MNITKENYTKETYYDELSKVQNCPCNITFDIMTITGFMDVDQRLKHLNFYKNRAIKRGQLK